MLKLRFKDNPNQSVWLVEPKVTLGGSPENDLVLSGVNTQMHHADVLVEHERVQLRLAKGAGDAFINERRITGDKVYSLAVNDIVRICGQELQLVDPKQEPRSSLNKPKVAASTGWALKANSAALSNRVYTLSDTTVVGRSNECDISLGAAHLSRRHASLHVKNGLLYVKDLGSSNGTYLNGERVTEVRVKRGDELCFDTLSFGVIGPSDELDKTTVRSVVRPTPAKATGAAAVVTDGKASARRRAQPRRASNVVPPVTVSKKPSKALETAAEQGKSNVTPIVVGLLALVVLAAGYWWLS